MIEFAIVLMIARLSGNERGNGTKQPRHCQSHHMWDTLPYSDTFRNHSKVENEKRISEGGNQLDGDVVFNNKSTSYSKTDVIDCIAFLVFFLAYLIFNLTYMPHYM